MTTTLFYTLIGIAIGGIINIATNVTSLKNHKLKFVWFFYLISALLIFLPIIYIIKIYDSLSVTDYILPASSLILGIALALISRKYLTYKEIFSTKELTPLIMDFTDNADRADIKLFGGDLNFFGEGPEEMDENEQYRHLIRCKFKHISFLCEAPSSLKTKIRYGKILNDFSEAELKFYNPNEADLHIRGRLKTQSGVEKLMIYNKVASKVYETIQTDTANCNGALYNNIWKLIWSLADNISKEQIDEYKKCFHSYSE